MSDRAAESRVMLERAVVGAVLRDDAALAVVELEPDHFQDKALRVLYRAALSLLAESKPVDPVTAVDRAARDTGMQLLPLAVELVQESTATTSSAHFYARRLRELEAQRRAMRVTDAILAGKLSLEEGSARLSQIMTEQAPAGQHAAHYVDELTKWLDIRDPPGVPTGIGALDEQLGGLNRSDLVVLAARSSMGKTALAANIMRHAAGKGWAVGMISGEQPGREIIGRLGAMTSPVDYSELRRKMLKADDRARLAAALAELREQRIMIADGKPEISSIQRIARRWHGIGELHLLIVDYLQIIRGGTGEAFRLQVADVVQQLKELAKSLDIPVLALAQVSRDCESRPLGPDYLGRMPWMADIAESAAIEHTADVVMTLYRPSVYTDAADPSKAFINICKNRHGRIGVVPAHWTGRSMVFSDAPRDPGRWGYAHA